MVLAFKDVLDLGCHDVNLQHRWLDGDHDLSLLRQRFLFSHLLRQVPFSLLVIYLNVDQEVLNLFECSTVSLWSHKQAARGLIWHLSIYLILRLLHMCCLSSGSLICII